MLRQFQTLTFVSQGEKYLGRLIELSPHFINESCLTMSYFYYLSSKNEIIFCLFCATGCPVLVVKGKIKVTPSSEIINQ